MVDFYRNSPISVPRLSKTVTKWSRWHYQSAGIGILLLEWAANTAIQNTMSIPKVKVLPFGANILCDGNLDGIREFSKVNGLTSCKLLFIGVDWQRKGGDTAIKVAELLNQRGIRTELKIVGCNHSVNLPGFAKCYGFVSKKTGRRVRKPPRHVLAHPQIPLLDCSFTLELNVSAGILRPSKLFGLPSSSDAGGRYSFCHQNGKNGQTFPLDSAPDTYCDYIERLMSSKQEYTKLALSSFDEYSNRLNWVSSARKLKDLITEFCG